MKFTEKKKIILAVVALIFSVSDVRAVGQAAIPTILLAPGARATALGEAYVGLSDDVDAIFYNPGALGLQPMSNAWKIYQLENGLKFSILAGKKKLLFGEKASLWASTSDNTLHKFDGSQWLSYEVFFLEQNYNIAKVVKKYLGMEDTLSAQDSLFLDAAVKRVRKYNDIELPEDEENIPDFRIPFSVVLSGRTIISMAVDPSNRLWVSTDIGLYTYASGRWKLYATGKDGLPNALVKSIYAGSSDVWVATDSGAAKFSKGEWTIQKTAEFTGTDAVNTIMIDDGDAVWIGTTNGLVRRKGKSVTIYDSTNGLVDNDVRAFALDAERNVWAATKNGLSRYRLKAWKKFRMDGNEVFSVTADTRDYIWLSTKKGALRYYKGALETKDGKSEIVGAYWKHFHAKNGLPSDKVSMIIPQGRDVWVLTDKGIGRFDKAEKQVAAFYENLLPEFALPDLYHLNLSGTYPTEDWGTLGAFVKYISFGTSKWTDELGKELGEFNSYDMFIGVSYGTSFGNNLGVGISPKFIYSKLSDVPVGNEKRKGISYSYAVDFGLKYRDVVKNLDFGLALQNMGPDIVYIDQNQADPIPFNLRAGICFNAIRTPVHDLKLLFDVNRELVKRNDPEPPDPFWLAIFTSLADDPWKQELSENVWSLGVEYWYSQFLALRTGTMYDKAGSRGEVTFGLGINVSNFQVNVSYILGTPIIDNAIGDWLGEPKFESYGSARNKQFRTALNFLM